jgi:hypothetical protein
LSREKLSLTNTDNWFGGYGSTSVLDSGSLIPSITLEDIQSLYNLKFNVLVADCEGYLETFFRENPSIVDQLRIVIFEADYEYACNYEYVRNLLTSNGFVDIVKGFQNVYIKNL